MLNKIGKAIGRKLLKIEWFKREVDRYKLEQWHKKIELEKQESKRYFDALKLSSKSIRREDKEDGRMLAVGMDTRGMGQRPFNPVFTAEDCVNWGIKNGGDMY